LADIPKCPEIPAHMVEDPIEHHPDTGSMKLLYQPGKGFIRPQPLIHVVIIGSIISMG